MRFRLYLACRDGIPLTGNKIIEGRSSVGDLSIEDVPDSLRQRFRSVARFRRWDADKREMRRPLFDPVLVAIADRHFELSGFEFAKSDGERTYQMQRWVLIAPDEGPLKAWPPERSPRRINLCSPDGKY